jgi:hypothetical protein
MAASPRSVVMLLSGGRKRRLSRSVWTVGAGNAGHCANQSASRVGFRWAHRATRTAGEPEVVAADKGTKAKNDDLLIQP